MNKPALRIAFVHPSLGIGGAERLVIDAAHALTQRGHQVTIFTGDFDPDRAFDDVRNGALNVQVHGGLLPSDVKGHLKAPLAIVRTGYVALRTALTGKFDVIFVDLIAQVLPILRSYSDARLIFYCHYPDKWLTPSRERMLYRWYRAPLDYAEGRALAYADKVLVNSHFTKRVLERTFPALPRASQVLSPAVDTNYYTPPLAVAERDEILLLSLARYEPKKNIALAIHALAALRARLEPALFERVRLVHAGGLSATTAGAEQTFAELSAQVEQLALRAHVRLETSISNVQKRDYLQRARALVYTPENEHFGIVPLEAMACGVPVVAQASGGPLETIRDGETGFLCTNQPAAFADRLASLVCSSALSRRLGAAGRKDAVTLWSQRAFAESIERTVADLAG